jgi:sugar phosphate isomerase/epimerase
MDELAGGLEEYGCTVPILRAQMRSPESMGEVCATAARLGARYLHVPAVQQSAQRSRWVEELGELAAQAENEGLAVLLSNRRGSLAESADELSAAVRDVGHPNVFAGYDPAEITLAGGSAFYTTGLYKGPLRRCTHHVDLRDVVIQGNEPAMPGMGNAQIKEIISNLRCRSYDGHFCLWPMPGEGIEGLRTAARGFWAIMDNI